MLDNVNRTHLEPAGDKASTTKERVNDIFVKLVADKCEKT